uniref:Dynein light chain n=1 Tax=Parascaris univalens TaxID=6257 RepID=A0A915A9S7_PARUN
FSCLFEEEMRNDHGGYKQLLIAEFVMGGLSSEVTLSRQPRVTLRSVEMNFEQALFAQTVAKEQILAGNTNEKAIASALRHRFDEKYGPWWQCIVGSSFGSFVTHRNNHFIYFYIDDFAVLLYKSA